MIVIQTVGLKFEIEFIFVLILLYFYVHLFNRITNKYFDQFFFLQMIGLIICRTAT